MGYFHNTNGAFCFFMGLKYMTLVTPDGAAGGWTHVIVLIVAPKVRRGSVYNVIFKTTPL